MSDVPRNDVGEGVRGEGQLLQAMVAHWIHEDDLYWMQIRHLLVLQIAAIAAWFALGVSGLAVILMIVAGIFSARIYGLANVIRRNRDANQDAIKVLSLSTASSRTRSELKPILGRDFETYGLFRYASHSLDETMDEGKRFQGGIFLICIAANLAIAVATWYAIESPDNWLRNMHHTLKNDSSVNR